LSSFFAKEEQKENFKRKLKMLSFSSHQLLMGFGWKEELSVLKEVKLDLAA